MKTRLAPVVQAARREDGASVIILALMLVVLLSFAAIAVDAAAAWALHRQGQSGADTGAVAGALLMSDQPDPAQAMEDAETEVKRITYSTISPDMTPSEWAAAWSSCTDPGKPTEFTQTHSSDCVSFSSNLDRIRVHTPDVPWKTTFAAVMGFNEVQTSAIAEVSIVLDANGGVMPFGMPANAQGDTEICLKTGSNPKNVAPCDGPDTGNFGFLDITQFGNSALGTSTQCTGGGTDRLVRSIAQGVDHPLGTTPDPAAPSHSDRDACNDGHFTSGPYHLTTEPGNVAQALNDGYVDGVGTTPGRLDRGNNRTPVRGHMLDDEPLWDHLNTAGKDLCGWSISDHDDLIDCLAAYTVADGVIFNSDIIKAPRFGWVPLFHEATLGNGSTTLTIKEFRPVYIQTTLWKCNASGCDLEWNPGEGVSSGSNNVEIEASTAVNIPPAALPQKVRDEGPGSSDVSYLLSK